MADVAFINATSAASAMAGTSVTVAKPAGVVAGVTMIASICTVHNNGNTVPTSIPSGWTAFCSFVGRRMYWKVAGGSEPADYTWDFTSLCATFQAPVLGIIAAYSDFGTRGLNDGLSALYGAASVGIPGYTGQAADYQIWAPISHTPPTVKFFRYPTVIAAFDEDRGTLTTPSSACNHANQRKQVTQAGFWTALGQNTAWTLTFYDILAQTVLHQPEIQSVVTVASTSANSSGNTTVGVQRNGDAGTETEIAPPVPVPRAVDVEPLHYRMRTHHLPYDLRSGLNRTKGQR